jgi:hypothetical protein
MTNWRIHAILVNDKIPFKDAEKVAQDILKKDKIFYRHEGNNFRFRNIPKTRFNKYRSKIVNDDITIVFGLLKPEYRI